MTINKSFKWQEKLPLYASLLFLVKVLKDGGETQLNVLGAVDSFF